MFKVCKINLHTVNFKKRPVDRGGSNTTAAYVSKPKFKPTKASRLQNQNLRTTYHNQPGIKL